MDASPIDRRALPAGAAFSDWLAGDGWTLRRLDWPQPGTARGSLFFAGGRGDFAEKYIEALAHWHARGWSIVSLDWRGQGGSRGNIVGGNVASFDPLVADCGAFLRAWTERAPRPHVAVAHSMGGHLLLRTLAEHRPALAAAVLVAPMLAINSHPVPHWAAPLVARAAALLGLGGRLAWKATDKGPAVRIRQRNLTSSVERYEDERYWKAQQPGFELGPPSWGWLAAAYASMRKPEAAALRRIATPLLLIGTDRDRLVAPEAIRRAAALLPQAELRMFPEAAHELLRESDEVRLDSLAAIDAFFDRHAAA